MKKEIQLTIELQCIVIAAITSVCMGAQTEITLKNADIVGAGATFPAPLYPRWIKEFRKKEGRFSISYNAVGSGTGTKRFMTEEVDFGASDFAMNDEQIGKETRGVQLIPASAGIIVLAYILPYFQGELRLSREVCTDISDTEK